MADERDVTSASSDDSEPSRAPPESGERSQSDFKPATQAGGLGDRTLPRDLRQELTDRMVAALDQGTIPWERPWHEVKTGRPRNLQSGRDYQGGNRFMLMVVQLEKGYADPRFGTVRQINQLDGTVSKGEKGFPIEYWSDQPFYDRRDVQISYGGERVSVLGEDRQGVVIRGAGSLARPRTIAGQDLSVWHEGRGLSWREAHQTLDRLVARVSTVFNVEQTTGLTLDAGDSKANSPVPAVERAERLLASMQGDGLKFEADPRAAYYVHPRDTVYLPERDRFDSSEGYYGTALHEVGHATGAAKRLNREGITGDHRYGTEGYAREELRAELFSVFVAADTGIPHDESQHRAYIQSWAKILKSDKHEIFRAASEAGKAVDYVLRKEQELVKTPQQSAERHPEPAQKTVQAEEERKGSPDTRSTEPEHKSERRRSSVRRRAVER